MAVITALAVGTVASVAASKMKANADKKSAQGANSANQQQYYDSRGANGNAILPMYADPGTEKRLFDEAVAASDAMGGGMTPQQIYAQYQQILAGLQPTIDAGNGTIADIYNGNMLADSLAFQQPVMDARTGAAVTNRDAIELARRAEANRIQAEEARKGYGGAGTFLNNRLLDATVQARQRAAGVISNATLANAEDTAGINRADQALRINSLDIAPNRAGQLIKLNQAPAEGVANLQTIKQKPLTFFRLNTGTPPPVQPVPNTGAGQLALQGIGQAAGAYGNYAAQGRVAGGYAPTSGYAQTGYDWQGNPVSAPVTAPTLRGG